MDICIDFDGTCVTHEFPKVGKDIGAAPVLKELVDCGHRLILFTMRSDIVNPRGENNELHLESGNYLTDAVKWFMCNEISLWGIQANPEQHTWTTSPKAYGQLYIDDAALGCPLKQDWLSHPDGHYSGEPVPIGRPYVDWMEVRKYLINQGIITKLRPGTSPAEGTGKELPGENNIDQ